MFCEGCSEVHRAIHQHDWATVALALRRYSHRHFLLLESKAELFATTGSTTNHLLVYLSIISQLFDAGASIRGDDDMPATTLRTKTSAATHGGLNPLECCKSLPLSRLLSAISQKMVGIANSKSDAKAVQQKCSNSPVQQNLSNLIAHSCCASLHKMVRYS